MNGIIALMGINAFIAYRLGKPKGRGGLFAVASIPASIALYFLIFAIAARFAY